MSHKILILGDFQWDFEKGGYIARPTGISVLADIFANGLTNLGCDVIRHNLWSPYTGSYDFIISVSWWGEANNLVTIPQHYGYDKIFPMVITDGMVPPVYAKILSTATKVLATSKYTKDVMIRDGIPESKVETILEAIDTDLFKPEPREKKDDTIDIFWHFWHGGDMAIADAIDPIVEEFDNVRFITKIQYAQTREHLRKFKERIKHQERLTVFNISLPYEKLPNLYNSCDIFMSLGGSMGGDLPILEAMACGKLVIALDRSSAKEFITHEVNGLLVRIGTSEIKTDIKAGIPIREHYDYPDPEDLIEKLKYAVEHIDMLDKMSKNARRTIVENFNINKRCKELLEVISECL